VGPRYVYYKHTCVLLAVFNSRKPERLRSTVAVRWCLSDSIRGEHWAEMAGLSRSAGQSLSRDSPFAEVMGELQLDAVKFASETGACRLRSDPARSAASLNCVCILSGAPPMLSPLCKNPHNGRPSKNVEGRNGARTPEQARHPSDFLIFRPVGRAAQLNLLLPTATQLRAAAATGMASLAPGCLRRTANAARS
jgi:hypothetical protein